MPASRRRHGDDPRNRRQPRHRPCRGRGAGRGAGGGRRRRDPGGLHLVLARGGGAGGRGGHRRPGPRLPPGPARPRPAGRPGRRGGSGTGTARGVGQQCRRAPRGAAGDDERRRLGGGAGRQPGRAVPVLPRRLARHAGAAPRRDRQPGLAVGAARRRGADGLRGLEGRDPRPHPRPRPRGGQAAGAGERGGARVRRHRSDRRHAGECLPGGISAGAVAEAVLFLLSDRAAAITGQTLVVDAGASA